MDSKKIWLSKQFWVAAIIFVATILKLTGVVEDVPITEDAAWFGLILSVIQVILRAVTKQPVKWMGIILVMVMLQGCATSTETTQKTVSQVDYITEPVVTSAQIDIVPDEPGYGFFKEERDRIIDYKSDGSFTAKVTDPESELTTLVKYNPPAVKNSIPVPGKLEIKNDIPAKQVKAQKTDITTSKTEQKESVGDWLKSLFKDVIIYVLIGIIVIAVIFWLIRKLLPVSWFQ